MTETRDARIDRLRAVAATSHLRSPLARWLSANHDEFARLCLWPRWEALVEQFGAEGLLELPPEFTSGDPHLRAMTPKIVKATMRIWERVHRLRQEPAASAAGVAAAPPETQLGPPTAPRRDNDRAVVEPLRRSRPGSSAPPRCGVIRRPSRRRRARPFRFPNSIQPAPTGSLPGCWPAR